MGRGRGGGRGGRGRGGRGGARGNRSYSANNAARDTRTNKADLPRVNNKFESYYNTLDIVPAGPSRDAFWTHMRTDLPNSFRFTGSRGHALSVQEKMVREHIPEITSIEFDDKPVEAPQPVEWYPDKLAWFMTTPKNIIRRFKPFAKFQKFLVAETDVGNISRQEVVSMIPPLCMGIEPGMTVLDLCAAPGSKSAQILEMICAGEEERAREVAAWVAEGKDVEQLVKEKGELYADDGRATGLLVANDVDYKRAHMLVHQMKRLSSPNIIVTNHDATIFPSMKIGKDEGGQVKYLKFDRILADVPCSGDGTLRKNLEIWKSWTPSNALGLHSTQVRILIRALQMLKVGGRVVYSTCSMNPVEDEAVLLSAINQCGGLSAVELVDTKDVLPGLVRAPGLRKWKIMDKAGRIWESWDDVVQARKEKDDENLASKLTEGMFDTGEDIPLERAMRVYPHMQNTGSFFIAILEKKREIRVGVPSKPQPVKATETNSQTATLNITEPQETTEAEVKDLDGTTEQITSTTNGSVADIKVDTNGETINLDPSAETNGTEIKHENPPLLDRPSSPSKRKRESSAQPSSPKRLKRSPSPAPTSKIQAPTTTSSASTKRNPNQTQFEEPYTYLPASSLVLSQITQFYNLSPTFPLTRFMVRNDTGAPSKNIYYTTSLSRSILTENAGKGMKFVHSGVKMFVKQDAPSAEVCPWRIQTDGLRILEAWVGDQRKVIVRRRGTVKRLLGEMFPRFVPEGSIDNKEDWNGLGLGELEGQMGGSTMGMGCCVLIIEPASTTTSTSASVGSEGAKVEANGSSATTDEKNDDDEGGFSERMVFPLWKSIHSLNLMLPKEDRKAMLLRLFDDDTPLLNNLAEARNKQSQRDKERRDAERRNGGSGVGRDDRGHRGRGGNGRDGRENTSSPEPMDVQGNEEEGDVNMAADDADVDLPKEEQETHGAETVDIKVNDGQDKTEHDGSAV